MGWIKTAYLYTVRKPVNTLLLIMIVAIIFTGEMTALLLYDTSVQAEKDAFNYNGASIFLEGGNLTDEDYKTIEEIAHVNGISKWYEILAEPVNAENVKEHAGIDPVPTGNETSRRDSVVILAEMCIPMYNWFRWEKSVSVIEGEYADEENRGVMIEKRFAKQNGVSLGDEVEVYVEEFDVMVKIPVCGIYEVETEFVIKEDNEYGEDVYIYSPYNVLFMDYNVALSVFQFETYTSGGAIYVDDMNHIQSVTAELYELFGEGITVYDNTTNYLENECSVVGIMQGTSRLISIMVIALGIIILLFVLSIFSKEYQHETALFLALGQRRRQCIQRYVLILLTDVILGVIVGLGVFVLGAEWISNLMETVGMDIISETQSIAKGIFETPNLGQGFRIEVNPRIVYSEKNFLILFGVMGATWVIGCLLPLTTVLGTKARTILQNKE